MDARIEITRQDAQIAIHTEQARVEISTQRPHFHMHKSAARMDIARRAPRMRIDRTQLTAGIGIGPVMLAARESFRQAAAAPSMGILPASGNMNLSIARENILATQSVLPLSVGALPQAEVQWDPGNLNISWTPASFEMEWDVSAWADIRVMPNYVEIRMVKYPEISIRVAYDSHIKRHFTGRFVDNYL